MGLCRYDLETEIRCPRCEQPTRRVYLQTEALSVSNPFCERDLEGAPERKPARQRKSAPSLRKRETDLIVSERLC